jgi:hypothetical protein
MVPGMSHCLAGPGPNGFDPLTALDQLAAGWSGARADHRDQIRQSIFAYFGLPAKALGTRPLCAYPKVARWTGTGSTDDAANFAASRRTEMSGPLTLAMFMAPLRRR